MKDNKQSQKKGKEFEVPIGGSLGLLALGNVGIRAWKKAKQDNKEAKENGGEKA